MKNLLLDLLAASVICIPAAWVVTKWALDDQPVTTPTDEEQSPWAGR